ncbi:unnamed protein product [Adineta steineri]|uniref:G-protein coupled receptors family 1 profile domain-containing protein n=1 Tax=Adineta steineri TaxID=433720 RepID=A0A815NT42_9BILA|nr:unnamed protein product [Adineta steineri]CAF3647180.1 unnamed protein product [Adineta steineri]
MAVTILPFVQQVITRYGITIYFALGVIGNICNFMMFMRPSYRRMPGSIYFRSLSIFSTIYLFWVFVPLFNTLDHADAQLQSLLYCKIKSYGSHVFGQCIRSVVVFACADRFFLTRTNVRIRSLSSSKIAMKLVFIICPVWLLIAIHMPILTEIKGSVCGTFGLYKTIYSVYQFISVVILPLTLMSIFSILTVRSLRQRNANQTHARQRDRDFMRMVMAEIIAHISTSIIYSGGLIYSALTTYVGQSSAQEVEIEAFILFLTQFSVHLTSVVSFYMFLITSKPFRNEFIKMIMKYWQQYITRQVSIFPLTQITTQATINVGAVQTK